VGRVTQMMSEIAAASGEQLSGIEQVSRTVGQMDRVVQENASLVAEQAVAAEHLARIAARLVDSVARFRLAHGEEEVAVPSVAPQAAPQARAPQAPQRAVHLKLVPRAPLTGETRRAVR
jgi:methyl-accepting chemotaxis protein